MGGGHAAPEAETLVVMEPVEEIPADEPGDGGELQELCVQPRHRLTCVCVRGGGFAEGVCWVMQVLVRWGYPNRGFLGRSWAVLF
jgi:hypothetical protein